MRTHLSVYTTGALLCNEGGSLREKEGENKNEGKKGWRRRGERRGQEVGKDDCLQRFSLCWFSLPSEGLLLSGGLAQPYGFSFLLSVFFFYLSGSQSWPPLKQDLEKTEAPRVAPLEVMTWKFYLYCFVIFFLKLGHSLNDSNGKKCYSFPH